MSPTAVDLIMKKETLLFLEAYNKNPKECLNCGSPILFKPGDKLHKFKKRKFCSLKCSRENTSKNKKNHTCYSCGDKRDKNSELCRKCFNIINNPINEKTLGSFIQGEKYLSSKCQSIRKDARVKMEKWFPIETRECKYCKTKEFKDVLEVHHLKNILSFSLETKIKEINNIDNMIWVCPSHHAMIEKGLLV